MERKEKHNTGQRHRHHRITMALDRFAQALQSFQLARGSQASPLDLVNAFKSIAAQHALAAAVDGSRALANYELETRLWHLVALLYGARLSPPPTPVPELEFSSEAVRQHNILCRDARAREALLITQWIHANTEQPASDAKGAKASPELTYAAVYRHLLANDIDGALALASDSGNFALVVVMLGAFHDYVDPVVDEQYRDVAPAAPLPLGQRHRFLWRRAVYRLLQHAAGPNERLIYNYLCGADIAANLDHAEGDWEQQLLLYVRQWLAHITANRPDPTIPEPLLRSIDAILNVLQQRNPAASRHPLRVLCGGVMIERVSTLLHDAIKKSAAADDEVSRVVTHLALVLHMFGAAGYADAVGDRDVTRAITLYIERLARTNRAEYIPIYLSAIPSEADARESYSLFLASLTDDAERKKQIENARSNVPDGMANVLRRTVERVMLETEPHYRAGGVVVVTDTEADPTDFKLYRTVEWFFDNRMHEDAILASVTTFRRFLLCGKLAAARAFGRGKHFKQLIRDYDFDDTTRTLSDPDAASRVTEDTKEELVQYEQLVGGLVLIEDWHKFLRDHQVNGTTSGSFWRSGHVQNSIEKVCASLNQLIFGWFTRLAGEGGADADLFGELRTIYVPYLVMELLQIYQLLRLNDWKYVGCAFGLVNAVGNDEENDLLACFRRSGRLPEFVGRCGELAAVASERGVRGIFA